MSDQLATALLSDTGIVLGELVIRYAPGGHPCAGCGRAAALELEPTGRLLPQPQTAVPICSRCLVAGVAVRLGADHLHAGGTLDDLRYRAVDEAEADEPIPPEWT